MGEDRLALTPIITFSSEFVNGPYEALGEFFCSFCVAFEGCIGKDQYMRPLRICFRRIPIVAHTAEFRLAVFRKP